jgi:cellulose synthase/poly-beta-1,6-N-acetylglucosamine synthase-like glycosyltransferase
MIKPADAKRVDIFLCNDGGEEYAYRQELCDEHNAKFVCRPNRGHHGKAGNQNYTLQTCCADYDFIVILGADMAPRKNCVDILLQAIMATTPQVCMVQAPHRFRDLRKLDLFQSRNLLFHAIFLPYYGACGFCPFVGSNAIFRNQALRAVDNFPTTSVTEDVLLGLRLHSLNYRSLYITSDVAYGTSPQSGAQLLNQRMRWSWGGIELFIKEVANVLALGDFYAMLPYLNLGVYNLLFGPIMLTMVIMLAVAVIFNIDFLPARRNVRMSLINICIQRIGLIIGCGGPTWRDFMLVNSEFISASIYGPFFEIVLSYNFVKFVVTRGKGLKVFKSTASTMELEPEHILIYSLAFLAALFFGCAGALGIYRSLHSHYYTYLLLSLSLSLKCLYIFGFLGGVAKPLKQASKNYHAPVEIVAERVFHSRMFPFMISLPVLELVLFIAAIISAVIYEY